MNELLPCCRSLMPYLLWTRRWAAGFWRSYRWTTSISCNIFSICKIKSSSQLSRCNCCCRCCRRCWISTWVFPGSKNKWLKQHISHTIEMHSVTSLIIFKTYREHTVLLPIFLFSWKLTAPQFLFSLSLSHWRYDSLATCSSMASFVASQSVSDKEW